MIYYDFKYRNKVVQFTGLISSIWGKGIDSESSCVLDSFWTEFIFKASLPIPNQHSFYIIFHIIFDHPNPARQEAVFGE